MKRVYGLPLFALLLCLALFVACAKKEEQEEKPKENEETKTLTLTLQQQETIGLMTEKAVVRTVRPVIASFGRVIPRLQGQVQVASPVVGRVTPQSVTLIPAPGTPVRQGQLLAEVEQTYTAPEQVQLDVGEKGAIGAAQEAKAAL